MILFLMQVITKALPKKSLLHLLPPTPPAKLTAITNINIFQKIPVKIKYRAGIRLHPLMPVALTPHFIYQSNYKNCFQDFL